MTVAERWFYAPIIGLLGMAGAVLHAADEKTIKPGIRTFIIIVIILLAIRTTVRNKDWNNALTLYNHDIRISEESFGLESNLGNELYLVQRYEEAKAHLERSVQLAPNWWGNWNNLGNVYLAKKDLTKAKSLYLRAIVNNENFDVAYNNLAYVLLLNREPTEAKRLLENAIRKFPDKPRFFLLLAIAEYNAGNTGEALRLIEYARQAYPTPLTESVYSRMLHNEPVILE